MPPDQPGYLRIATEEAFAPPELLAAWRPYQFVADEVTEQDRLPIGAADKKAFFQTNAETVFRL